MVVVSIFCVEKKKNENIQIWSRYSLFKNIGCRLPASSSAALTRIKVGFQGHIRNLSPLVNSSFKQTCNQRCMVHERHCNNNSSQYIRSLGEEEKFIEIYNFHECWCISYWPTLLPLAAPGSPICSRGLVIRTPWCLPYAHSHLCHRWVLEVRASHCRTHMPTWLEYKHFVQN